MTCYYLASLCHSPQINYSNSQPRSWIESQKILWESSEEDSLAKSMLVFTVYPVYNVDKVPISYLDMFCIVCQKNFGYHPIKIQQDEKGLSYK